MALAWLVVNHHQISKFPEYFAECFSLSIVSCIQARNKLNVPDSICCVWESSEDIHGLEATSLVSFPALCWESHQVSVSETGIKWRCVKSKAWVNCDGKNPGPGSLTVAGPKAWYSWPLEKHKARMGDLFDLPLCQSFAFLVSSYLDTGATCKAFGVGCLGPCQGERI